MDTLDSLNAQVRGLQDRADHSFSHLADVAPAAATTVTLVQAQLAADQVVYNSELATYRQKFGFASRFAAGVGLGQASAYSSAHITPIETRIKTEQDLLAKANAIVKGIADTSGPLSKVTAYKSGIALVYNSATDSLDRQESYKSGVAGVFNPDTRQTEWKTSYKEGVAGVWNPLLHKVEWKTSYKSGIAGVWNPDKGQVDWQESYKSGVAGVWDPVKRESHFETSYKSCIAVVWNPLTQKVESKSAYKSGIVGYFDESDSKVKFVESYKSGVAIAVRGKLGVVTASADYGAIAGAIQEDDDE